MYEEQCFHKASVVSSTSNLALRHMPSECLEAVPGAKSAAA